MKLTILFSLSVFLILFALACKAKPKNSLATDQAFAELRTTGCYGFCPVFRLTFFGNRRVEYEGLYFVKLEGIKNFEISAAEMANLKAKISSVNLWQYPDRIESLIQDGPGATLTVFEKDKQKSTMGTMDRPQPLMELEAMMRQLAEKYGIDVSTGVDPKAPKPASRAEIIVKLSDDLNAGNWVMQFEELRLRLVRRIPPDNMWVLAYDTAQIDEKTLLELVRGLDGVLFAQPNMQVQERH